RPTASRRLRRNPPYAVVSGKHPLRPLRIVFALLLLGGTAAEGLKRENSGVRGENSGPGRPGWLPTPASGKEVTSPPPPPLRTARESFPSCSSSLSNALCRTRLSHI